ncbi:MAG: alpha/beta hydrolase family esterase [Candidatus Hydrogenedentota bacterium]
MSPRVWGFFVLTLALLLVGCPSASNVRHGILEHDGQLRSYRLYTPSGLTSDEAVPLVVVLHPFMGGPRQMARMTGFDAIAEREGFLAVYPNGVTRRWSADPGETRAPGPFRTADDVGFIVALLDRLEARHPVDPERVYVTGASNGAMMTYRLACEMPERFAAAAAVMAPMTRTLAEYCAPEIRMPFLIMMGTEDQAFPFEGGAPGGPGGGGEVLGARETAAFWAWRNGCAPKPERWDFPERAPGDGTRVSVETYRNCADGGETALYIVEGGGHTWPGQPSQPLLEPLVGPISREIDASEAIWEFFAAH